VVELQPAILAQARRKAPELSWIAGDLADVSLGRRFDVVALPGNVMIFLRPGSEAELERRLRARGTESGEAIERRLEVARRELVRADEYQYQVVNDTVDKAVQQIIEILENQGIVK